MNRATRARRGYALMLVLVFVVLFLAILGVGWRQVASVLRIETVRATQIRRDEGSLRALAKAIRLLETGVPTSGYVCNTTIATSGGTRWFTVTFTKVGEKWSVKAVPTPIGEPTHDNMPTTFPP